MSDLQRNLTALLEQAADRLREARVGGDVVRDVLRLAGQVEQPCVVAVVGRMKAGKSTFINALLGDDLARVGATETTATINYFRHGPTDPVHPVRCHWRSGAVTDESRDFLDSLQGNDAETLRRAEGIAFLEYHLLNPYLEHVTLVDTPGTTAVVGEHESRTAEFMDLRRRLEKRHEDETRRIGGEADAVIYLVGPVARGTDQDFLDEFAQATHGSHTRPLNALGVLAKVDLQAEILARRSTLAAKIAEQLKDSLNTVLPVSAGLRRAAQHLSENQLARLHELIAALRPLPSPLLDTLLADMRIFRTYQPAGCPLPTAVRERLLGGMPWRVFTTVARLAADAALSPAAILEQLDGLCGFAPLQQLLERHFFRRGQQLRCHRILADARKILNHLRYDHLPDLRRRDRDELAQRDRFLAFLRQTSGDGGVAREMEEFVKRQCGVVRRSDHLEALLADLERRFGTLFLTLQQHHADFEALQQLDQHAALFSGGEREELRQLFGLYGLDSEHRLAASQRTADYVEDRQLFWRQVGLEDRRPLRCEVARRAALRYGLLLEELGETKTQA
jgi:hypothetical protein